MYRANEARHVVSVRQLLLFPFVIFALNAAYQLLAVDNIGNAIDVGNYVCFNSFGTAVGHFFSLQVQDEGIVVIADDALDQVVRSTVPDFFEVAAFATGFQLYRLQLTSCVGSSNNNAGGGYSRKKNASSHLGIKQSALKSKRAIHCSNCCACDLRKLNASCRGAKAVGGSRDGVARGHNVVSCPYPCRSCSADHPYVRCPLISHLVSSQPLRTSNTHKSKGPLIGNAVGRNAPLTKTQIEHWEKLPLSYRNMKASQRNQLELT